LCLILSKTKYSIDVYENGRVHLAVEGYQQSQKVIHNSLGYSVRPLPLFDWTASPDPFNPPIVGNYSSLITHTHRLTSRQIKMHLA
jgi:hypothetical protein